MSRTTKYLLIAGFLLLVIAGLVYWYSVTYSLPDISKPQESQLAEQPQKEAPSVVPAKPTCVPKGQVLKGNQRLFVSANLLIAITSDASTYDANLGESHRKLTIYDTENCTPTFSQVLPVDISADYPYYLMPLDTTKGNLIAIIGSSRFYVYDIINKRLSPALKPIFKGERYLEDGQSGGIVGLETYGKYLVGYTQDQGMFAYNMTIPQNPKQEQPFAEYQLEDESHTSLFLLKSSGDSVQAIIPKFDANERAMSVSPLMESPQPVSQQVTKSAAINSRFVVMRMRDAKKTPMAIDMKTGRKIELPENIKNKANGEILTWLKNNRQK